MDADKVTLVLPILGLYAEVYAKHCAKIHGRRNKSEHGMSLASVAKEARHLAQQARTDVQQVEHEIELAEHAANEVVQMAGGELLRVEHAAQEALQHGEQMVSDEFGAGPGEVLVTPATGAREMLQAAGEELHEAEQAARKLERDVAQHVECDVERAEHVAHEWVQRAEQEVHQVGRAAHEATPPLKQVS